VILSLFHPAAKSILIHYTEHLRVIIQLFEHTAFDALFIRVQNDAQCHSPEKLSIALEFSKMRHCGQAIQFATYFDRVDGNVEC
jgi:hypothetical protein